MDKNITATLNDQIEINHDLEARLSQSENALAEAGKSLAKAAEDAKEQDTRIQALTSRTTEQAAQLEAKDKTVAELTAKVANLEATATTTAQQAGALLAQVGTQPVEGTTAAAPATYDELWAQYRALPITQQREFYLAHQKEMSGRH